MKLLGIFFAVLLSPILLFSSPTLLKKAELQKGELHLFFSKSYSKSNIRHFMLKTPYREVFDLKNVRLANQRVGKNLSTPHCQSIRVSQYRKKMVRIVIETEKKYVCNAYQPLFSFNSYHIPLPKFTVTHPTRLKNKHYVNKKKEVSGTKNVKKVSVVYNRPKKSVLEKFDKRASYALHRKERIVIDAGHGGHDTGAIARGKREKDLVLQIAKRLERQLKKRGYAVSMTRRSDRFIKLKQRTKIADKKDAKVFVSIHANSVPKRKQNKVHGIETFFLQTTRDAKSQRIAARENKAVLKGAGDKLSKHVIIDSVLNGPKIVQSNKLAIDVQRRIMTNLRANYRGVKDGGVRYAPFWVLVGASRPSILVEVGYISHPRERKRLFTPKYQELIAKGIAEGISNYLDNRRKEIDFD
ncbi:N-acetylmuramoyl-L-alanine amidase [Sulfurovum lithotrophicum]|uniref:N-acetylmuramoyl-L-alanine amidase n=1 Tax=Sulfurovum lithotrophicum TaxID=206403 RepID=A0A7U4RQ61_9BACT|nr:N-acetylmuramoyl-L-alanine amidase [Sulfurovum lithotrophicum]AKF24538.1 N-acetylmuramoyl-L-alanine amidase [Sulfurovum lithotrophicum]